MRVGRLTSSLSRQINGPRPSRAAGRPACRACSPSLQRWRASERLFWNTCLHPPTLLAMGVSRNRQSLQTKKLEQQQGAMGLHFIGNCLLHAVAGCGFGVVLDSLCARIHKRLVKTSLHNGLARVLVLFLQLFLFVLIATLEVVYSPDTEKDHEGTVASMFFEMMLFGTQFYFFEGIQVLTKDV